MHGNFPRRPAKLLKSGAIKLDKRGKTFRLPTSAA
jgi:hypothetical protein